MNERIKALLYEAGGQYDGHDVLTSVERVDTENVDYKKFAELIVRECLDIAKNWDNQLVNAKLVKESNAVGIVVYRIARQFGVEE